jgi:fibro-slime domain-containing protein
MFKESQFPVFVPRVLALAFVALVSSVFADEKKLDVILRDFPVNHYGFEMFDSDYNTNGKCAGSNPAQANAQAQKPENGVCVSGNNYVPCSGTLSKKGDAWIYQNQLMYGEYSEECGRVNNARKRGYKPKLSNDTQNPITADIEDGPNGKCKDGDWENPVFVTKNMVQDRLDYSQCSSDERGEPGTVDEALKGRYCARPMPRSGNDTPCYGENLQEWFTDGGAARRFEDIMVLTQVGNSKTYKIQYDYNTSANWGGWGSGPDRGYFPLDSMAGTYGKQSLNIWCGAHYPDKVCENQTGINYWRDEATAKRYIDNGSVPSYKFHNYGFTMAGSAEFKYDASQSDIFEFIGDDDMWIFIDGDLVVDLGGNHLAAPGKIDIKDYGTKKYWDDGSMHAINFFYTDRQTDGSNMMIKLAITNLTDPQFGAPVIRKAETDVKEDGTTTTLLYVSTQLQMGSLDGFRNGNTGYGFPILVYNYNDKQIYGYKLQSIDFVQRTGEGYTYTVTGVVCKNLSCDSTIPLATGDSLSFNVVWDDNWPSNAEGGFALSDGSKAIKNTIGREAVEIKWGPNATARIQEIVVKSTDTKPQKPPFAGGNAENFPGNGNPRQPDGSVPSGAGGPVPGGDGAYDGAGKFPNIRTVWDSKKNTMVNISDVDGAKNNNDIHGFGAVGKPIPPQRAGELILTALPNYLSAPYGFNSYDEWYQAYKEGKMDGDADLFGLPPEAKGEAWWGLADPTTEARGGGYQFVKNGFPNESSTKGNIKIAPTRCTARIDESPTAKPGERASINCLNFNMGAQQPFQLAVTVYDQLGNFVTQYRETVSEQDFRNATQAPNYLFGEDKLVSSPVCELPTDGNYGKKTTTTTNGFINVNVNIYPFSTTGRRFGNGVYIAKIDRVDLPFEGCQVVEGIASKSDPITGTKFKRFHSEQKFGWMRSDKK